MEFHFDLLNLQLNTLNFLLKMNDHYLSGQGCFEVDGGSPLEMEDPSGSCVQLFEQ